MRSNVSRNETLSMTTTTTTDFVLSASGTMACHAFYRILITRVTRTAVPTYCGTYKRPYSLYSPRWLATVHYMAVENGPSIDHRTPVTCTSRMDGFIRRKALANRFCARRIWRTVVIFNYGAREMDGKNKSVPFSVALSYAFRISVK